MKPVGNGIVLIIAGICFLSGCKDSPTPNDSDRESSTTADLANESSQPTSAQDSARHDLANVQDRYGTAVIQGVVSFEGRRPRLKPILMQGDPVCRSADRRIYPPGMTISKTGGVPHVFVYIKKGIAGRYTVPDKHATLNQTGCMFDPHVFGLQVGQSLQIVNGDDTAHNVHSLAKRNMRFNISQPHKNMTSNKVFSRREVMIKFKCDVHGWMTAYCGVMEHPFYAVTDASGDYSISRIPDGDYVLEAWHELWGTLRRNITISDGQSQEVKLLYSRRRPANKKP